MNAHFPISEPDRAGRVLTVAALNHAVAEALALGFPLVRVRGEIGNFTRAASGHWYFTLKDAAAQVRCAMFRGRNSLVGFQPRDGDEVEVVAQVGLYEARGEFQLTLESMRRAGQGRLFEEFMRLKARLEAAGLFDSKRKRTIAPMPVRIGVVTSLQAAALRDVLTTLRRRAPHVTVLVYPVPVQGEGAATRIATMLALAGARAEVDTLLLVRGGGSIEDLWSFNEEVVARAIVACPIPVVVGVGHESDFTIADFAADLRAATPSAAAELATPDRTALLQHLSEAGVAMGRALRIRLQSAQQGVDFAQRALATPAAALRGLGARVRELHFRALRTAHSRHHQRCVVAGELRRRHIAASGLIGSRMPHLTRLLSRLGAAAKSRHADRQRRFTELTVRLQALDPESVLQRGYAIVVDGAGRCVTVAAALRVGDPVQLRFAVGAAQARIEQIAASGTQPWPE